MPRDSSSRQHVANVLGALSLVVGDRMNTAVEAVAAHGPSAPAALAALHEFLDGGSMTELSSVLGLTHSGTVRLVDRLAAAGLVDRSGSSDGRAVSIALTRRGRRLAAQVLRTRGTSLEGALSELTAADLRDLSRVLDKMLTTMTLTRLEERSAPTPGRPQPWLCRLCEFEACGRNEGNCPVYNTARAQTTAVPVRDGSSSRVRR